MPYNPRDPNAAGKPRLKLNTNHSVAILVLVALVALWALRHIYGSIAVSAGTK